MRFSVVTNTFELPAAQASVEAWCILLEILYSFNSKNCIERKWVKILIQIYMSFGSSWAALYMCFCAIVQWSAEQLQATVNIWSAATCCWARKATVSSGYQFTWEMQLHCDFLLFLCNVLFCSLTLLTGTRFGYIVDDLHPLLTVLCCPHWFHQR